MKPTIHFFLAATAFFGASASAFAGASDQHDNGNDRYPWLSNQPGNGCP